VLAPAVEGGNFIDLSSGLVATTGDILTVPANRVYQLLYLTALIVTEATAATRNYILAIRSSGGARRMLLADWDQLASVTVDMSWGMTNPEGTTYVSAELVAGLSQPILLYATDVIKCTIANGQGSDALTFRGGLRAWGVVE